MNLFYDSIIFLYLIASGTLAVGLFRDRKRAGKWEHRHPTITITVSMFLCFSVLVVFWGSFIEPRLITVSSVSIDLPNFEPTQPVRAALISDIQVGDYKKHGWTKKVAKRIKSLNPDLVLMAGDIIQRTANDAQYLTDFKLLTNEVPAYAVLGDHDYYVRKNPHFSIDEVLADTVEQVLTNAHVDVLRNEARTIEIYGARFTLIGLDDWLAGKTDLPHALSLVAKPLAARGLATAQQSPIVVLVHNPDFILAPESKNADLILAGNTHGGQIRLPFIGPIGRWNSALPTTYDEGLFMVNNHTRLFITSGIGESGPRARLFNPPEVVLLELH